MGQYFKPVILIKNDKGHDIPASWLHPHDFKVSWNVPSGKKITIGIGLKLMEHSYLDNPMLNHVEKLLMPGGMWHKERLLWAGDYADYEPQTQYGITDNENCDDICIKGKRIYHYLNDATKLIAKNKFGLSKLNRYIINHTLKQYVDKNKVPSNIHDMRIHPLPLLTCEGNGRGGGDYYSKAGQEFIGTWARHYISIDKKVPVDYTEIIPNFIEK